MACADEKRAMDDALANLNAVKKKFAGQPYKGAAKGFIDSAYSRYFTAQWKYIRCQILKILSTKI